MVIFDMQMYHKKLNYVVHSINESPGSRQTLLYIRSKSTQDKGLLDILCNKYLDFLFI